MTTYFVRDPEVKWYSCACNASHEGCKRHVLYEYAICEVCTIGCAEVQIVAPARHPVMVKTIISHTKMDLSPPMTPFYRQD